MKVKILKTFLDGRDRYEEGEVRNVPDDRAAEFAKHGWVAINDVAADATGGESTLAVDSVTHDTTVKVI